VPPAPKPNTRNFFMKFMTGSGGGDQRFRFYFLFLLTGLEIRLVGFLKEFAKKVSTKQFFSGTLATAFFSCSWYRFVDTTCESVEAMN
jgi:hypothetical protein